MEIYYNPKIKYQLNRIEVPKMALFSDFPINLKSTTVNNPDTTLKHINYLYMQKYYKCPLYPDESKLKKLTRRCKDMFFRKRNKAVDNAFQDLWTSHFKEKVEIQELRDELSRLKNSHKILSDVHKDLIADFQQFDVIKKHLGISTELDAMTVIDLIHRTMKIWDINI